MTISNHSQERADKPGGANKSTDSRAAVAWRSIVTKYQKSDARRALWQVVNTYVPYAALWYLMYRSLEISYWLTLALSLVASLYPAWDSHLGPSNSWVHDSDQLLL